VIAEDKLNLLHPAVEGQGRSVILYDFFKEVYKGRILFTFINPGRLLFIAPSVLAVVVDIFIHYSIFHYE